MRLGSSLGFSVEVTPDPSVSNQAAVKAVVASSRLGSASSSHSSIQENQKASREPSPIHDGSETVVEAVPKEKVQKDVAQVAAEMAEAELRKSWAEEENQNADTNDAEANLMVPEALGDGIEVADPEVEEGPAEEQLNIVEEEANPKEEQEEPEEPALGFGAEHKDVVPPEH